MTTHTERCHAFTGMKSRLTELQGRITLFYEQIAERERWIKGLQAECADLEVVIGDVDRILRETEAEASAEPAQPHSPG